MPRKISTFLFDGEQLTISEIKQRVPCLHDWSIRNLLSKGINTRMGMLSYKAPNNHSIECRKRVRGFGEKWHPK